MSPAAVIIIAAGGCLAALIYWACLDPPPRDPPAGPDAGPRTARPGTDEKPFPVGTGWLVALPDDEPADITGVQPPSTCYLGMPQEQYLNDLFPADGGELFDKHAEAQQ